MSSSRGHSAADGEPERRVGLPARRKRRIVLAALAPAAPFRDLERGETLVYHRGFLPDDRLVDPQVDALAREALRLSTGVLYHSGSSSGEIPVGAGLLELFQHRQPDGTYVYAARRIG